MIPQINYFFLLTLSFISYVNSQCTGAPPAFQNVLETDEPGYELFNITSNNAVWSFEITRDEKVFKPYFNFDLHNETYYFSINQTLDLEDIFNNTGIRLTSIMMKFYCKSSGLTQNYDYFLGVTEVNEFPPNFINPPFVRNITEDASINTQLIVLSEHAEDKDLNQSMNEIQGFKIHDYVPLRLDGQTKFEMPKAQDGLIRLKTPLDYETMDDKLYMLNVSVQDRGGLMDYALITVNVIDVDDQPPEFYYEGCQTKPCSIFYQTSVADDYVGDLTNLIPASIFARDRDTLGYPVSYSIVNGDIANITDYFRIDEVTGVVTIVRVLKDIDIASFSLTIKAEEVSTNRHSTSTFLWVTILGRATDGPSTQIVTQLVRGEDSTLKSAMIALGVIIFIIIIVFIVSIFFVRKRYRKPAISPLDLSPAGSEKGTDDEDLSMSDSDNWPSPIPPGKQERIIASLPEGRGSLPPIQYVETENETPSQYHQNITQSTLQRTSSKRSRKRNRENEKNEMYDGTREYEGTADCEFYTNKDKTKIKQSSKSRNVELDPKYWITVDNNY
ncbi:hypothetical protein SNE40_023623 [Patella caerulea]|uniref:Cadherin domain-containing protein n=1 Tax=Patella caerulea TaxID=87958 RepID=A0AAN8FZS5_PATCE